MTLAFSLHRLLSRIAIAATNVFTWVIVFDIKLSIVSTLTQALVETTILFLLSQAVLALAAPALAQLYAGGMVRLMLFGTLAQAASWVLLGAAAIGLDPIPFLIGFAVLSGLARAIYATPFSLIQHDAGRDAYLHELLYGLIPLASALFYMRDAATGGYVLFAAAALAIASAAFLVRFEAYEGFSWDYRETFGMLLEPAHRPYVFEHLLKGYEGAALFFLWPLFLYLILGHSYLALGVILTASLMGIAALHLLLPRHDTGSPLWASALAGGAWVARMIVVTPVPIVLVQLASTAGAPERMRDHQLMTLLADSGTFLDELTVLKELSLALGRGILAMVFIGSLATLPPFWALLALFLTAGLASAIATYRTMIKR